MVYIPAKVAAADAVVPYMFCMYFGKNVATDTVTRPMAAPANATHMNAGFRKSRQRRTGNWRTDMESPARVMVDTGRPSLWVSETRVSRTRLAPEKY